MAIEKVDAGLQLAGRTGIQGDRGYDSNWLVGWDWVGVVECEGGNLA